jgi:hypothetical protein
VRCGGVLESDSYSIALRTAQEKLRTLDPAAVAARGGAAWHPAADGATAGELHIDFFGQHHVVTLPDASVWVDGEGVPGVHPRPGTCPHCQADADAFPSPVASAPLSPDALASAPRLPASDDASIRAGSPADGSADRTAGGPKLERAAAPIWDAILILHYLGSEGPIPPRGEPIAFAEVRDARFFDPAFQERCRVPLERKFGPAPESLLRAAARLGGRPWDRGDVSAVVPAFPRVDVYLVLYRGDDDFPPAATVLFSSDVASFQSAEDVAVLGGAAVGRLMRALGGPTT